MKTLFEQTTNNTEMTEALGEKLATLLLADNSLPRFIALYGDLGVGKTVFTRGMAKVLSPSAAVRSPTFTLINQYKNSALPFYHFDMYRITGDDDLYSIGYYDYLTECEAGRAVCVVEWSQNIPYALPDRYIRVTVSKVITDSKKPLDGKSAEVEYSDAVFNIRTIKAEAVGK